MPNETVWETLRGQGGFNVSLELNDGFNGNTACSTTVEVVDTRPAVISCNAPLNVVPSDAPISFRASAFDGCDGTVAAAITGYTCYAVNRDGRKIDKGASCQVAYRGDTVTIADTGGIGNHIAWVVSATDGSGNATTLNCEVLVVKKR